MKVLIIDDDPDIVEVVSLCFEIRWPDAVLIKAPDGASGIQRYKEEGADIVILDLGLPDIDGLDVCRTLKKMGEVAIIILTVRDQPNDIVKGLEWGADDYITKPFEQMEFLARVQAVLRRSRRDNVQENMSFLEGGLTIDLDSRQVKLAGNLVKLTPTEYKLLYHLASNRDKLLTHEELLTKVWGEEYRNADEYLKVHIQHLRRKLDDVPDDPRLIATERGVGYRFIARSP